MAKERSSSGVWGEWSDEGEVQLRSVRSVEWRRRGFAQGGVVCSEAKERFSTSKQFFGADVVYPPEKPH